jgi:hypothetical protein
VTEASNSVATGHISTVVTLHDWKQGEDEAIIKNFFLEKKRLTYFKT